MQFTPTEVKMIARLQKQRRGWPKWRWLAAINALLFLSLAAAFIDCAVQEILTNKQQANAILSVVKSEKFSRRERSHHTHRYTSSRQRRCCPHVSHIHGVWDSFRRSCLLPFRNSCPGLARQCARLTPFEITRSAAKSRKRQSTKFQAAGLKRSITNFESSRYPCSPAIKHPPRRQCRW